MSQVQRRWESQVQDVQAVVVAAVMMAAVGVVEESLFVLELEREVANLKFVNVVDR